MVNSKRTARKKLLRLIMLPLMLIMMSFLFVSCSGEITVASVGKVVLCVLGSAGLIVAGLCFMEYLGEEIFGVVLVLLCWIAIFPLWYFVVFRDPQAVAMKKMQKQEAKTMVQMQKQAEADAKAHAKEYALAASLLFPKTTETGNVNVLFVPPYADSNYTQYNNEVVKMLNYVQSEFSKERYVNIIDRNNYDRIVEEFKFQNSAWSNEQKAEIGKALNANIIATFEVELDSKQNSNRYIESANIVFTEINTNKSKHLKLNCSATGSFNINLNNFDLRDLLPLNYSIEGIWYCDGIFAHPYSFNKTIYDYITPFSPEYDLENVNKNSSYKEKMNSDIKSSAEKGSQIKRLVISGSDVTVNDEEGYTLSFEILPDFSIDSRSNHKVGYAKIRKDYDLFIEGEVFVYKNKMGILLGTSENRSGNAYFMMFSR